MTRVTQPSDADFDELVEGPHESHGVEEPEPTGTRLDRWWAARLANPLNKRLWDWGGPIAVTLLAAALRLWHLGLPRSLVFDETYYVKDAWTLSHLGYEGAWVANADKAFNAGDASGWSAKAEFVAHPPLGKWIIALGEHLTGIQSSVGWRLSTAVVGILAVVLIILIAKKLFGGSTLLGCIAGLLMAVDGSAIVMSRVALLDNFVMFFALLGVGAVLLDRGYRDTRIPRLNAPVLWRPWLLAAGVAFGLCAGVKWSGFYFLAVFGVYVVLADFVAYRKAGFLASTTGLAQAIVSFVTIVPIAIATYVAAWSGWLFTGGGWDRHWVEQNPAQHAWHGLLSWVPYWAQNLWHYNTELYGYSINLHATHPYQSNPLWWTLMLRPTSMYYNPVPAGQNGCTAAQFGCSQAITDLGNPFIWWAGTLALLGLVYVLIRHRDWRAGLLLTAVGAGWLPWVILYHGRTIFTFYAIAFEPYLILGIVYFIAKALGSPADSTYRRTRGIAGVAAYLAIVLGATAFFWPIWSGVQTSYEFWRAHMWLRSWI
ncbi:phospholipid carrier-dependent glycosyltransferase [Gryllotalpicola protaetiae]|uniref:Polyprenol-phosphate-mannose--protein mannosyltransferase n=1 Tax=Gryllotalpicola protaetiae TaxID=2419771 RepID=A0A387BWI6_9MICO|nr:phospholipid carrier-dependent glycosyltransferase [Gryllotalpicola protaetiae]